MDCSSSLIPSRALEYDQHGRSLTMDGAHSDRIVCRLDSSSSLVAPTPTLSLTNRARADSIFPLIPGSLCQHVRGCLEMGAHRFTSCSFKSTFKEDFIRSTVRQPVW